MKNKVLATKQPPKWALPVIIFVIVLWTIIIYTGQRLPYLYTEFSFSIRAFFIAPLFMGFMFYFCFVYRKPGGKTGYMQAMQHLEKKEKIKGTIMGLIGFLLIGWCVSWSTVFFPAWAANISAKNYYAESFKISAIKARSGPEWSAFFDLYLIDSSGSNSKSLSLNRKLFDKNHWKQGEYICLIGRSSVFGTIIDIQTKDLTRCRK